MLSQSYMKTHTIFFLLFRWTSFECWNNNRRNSRTNESSSGTSLWIVNVMWKQTHCENTVCVCVCTYRKMCVATFAARDAWPQISLDHKIKKKTFKKYLYSPCQKCRTIRLVCVRRPFCRSADQRHRLHCHSHRRHRRPSECCRAGWADATGDARRLSICSISRVCRQVLRRGRHCARLAWPAIHGDLAPATRAHLSGAAIGLDPWRRLSANYDTEYSFVSSRKYTMLLHSNVRYHKQNKSITNSLYFFGFKFIFVTYFLFILMMFIAFSFFLFIFASSTDVDNLLFYSH